jgi:transposase InsO family protein
MMVAWMQAKDAYPIQQGCELMDLSRSTYYYQSHGPDESELIADVEEVLGQNVKRGTRRVCRELRRPPYNYRINRKRIQRIMRQKGWLRVVKSQKRHTTNSEHAYKRYPNLVKELEITHPDQVYASDITYIRLGHGFVYLAVVMDIYTRSIRGWCLSKRSDQSLSLSALEMALQDHVPEIHHSDQGVQYAANTYTDLLTAHKVQISMSAAGSPQENGYVERFMRTIKEEEVELSEYRDFSDARKQIGHFIEDVYNQKRIHSSLGYLTPAEFEADWNAKLSKVSTP